MNVMLRSGSVCLEEFRFWSFIQLTAGADTDDCVPVGGAGVPQSVLGEQGVSFTHVPFRCRFQGGLCVVVEGLPDV